MIRVLINGFLLLLCGFTIGLGVYELGGFLFRLGMWGLELPIALLLVGVGSSVIAIKALMWFNDNVLNRVLK